MYSSVNLYLLPTMSALSLPSLTSLLIICLDTFNFFETSCVVYICSNGSPPSFLLKSTTTYLYPFCSPEYLRQTDVCTVETLTPPYCAISLALPTASGSSYLSAVTAIYNFILHASLCFPQS